jgi:DnaD/phage-associated family protein
MPKDVLYVKHDSNAYSDPKIKVMRKTYGWEGYGWYWHLIELMRSEEDYQLEYSNLIFSSLSEDFNCTQERIKEFVDHCINTSNLFEKNDTHFYSARLNRDMNHLEKIRQQNINAGKQSGIMRSAYAQPPLSTRSTSVNTPQNEQPHEQKEHLLNERSTDGEPNNNIYNNKEDICNKNNKEDKEEIKIIFKTYEENIGMITPLITDNLKDAISHYPKGWLESAIKIASDKSIRNWSYISRILNNWEVSGFKNNYNGKKQLQGNENDQNNRYKRSN